FQSLLVITQRYLPAGIGERSPSGATFSASNTPPKSAISKHLLNRTKNLDTYRIKHWQKLFVRAEVQRQLIRQVKPIFRQVCRSLGGTNNTLANAHTHASLFVKALVALANVDLVARE